MGLAAGQGAQQVAQGFSGRGSFLHSCQVLAGCGPITSLGTARLPCLQVCHASTSAATPGWGLHWEPAWWHPLGLCWTPAVQQHRSCGRWQSSRVQGTQLGACLTGMLTCRVLCGWCGRGCGCCTKLLWLLLVVCVSQCITAPRSEVDAVGSAT